MSLKMSLNTQVNIIMNALFFKYDQDNSGYLD